MSAGTAPLCQQVIWRLCWFWPWKPCFHDFRVFAERITRFTVVLRKKNLQTWWSLFKPMFGKTREALRATEKLTAFTHHSFPLQVFCTFCHVVRSYLWIYTLLCLDKTALYCRCASLYLLYNSCLLVMFHPWSIYSLNCVREHCLHLIVIFIISFYIAIYILRTFYTESKQIGYIISHTLCDLLYVQ